MNFNKYCAVFFFCFVLQSRTADNLSAGQKTFEAFAKESESLHFKAGLKRGLYAGVGFLSFVSRLKAENGVSNGFGFDFFLCSIGLSLVEVDKWKKEKEFSIISSLENYNQDINAKNVFHEKNSSSFYKGMALSFCGVMVPCVFYKIAS